jgi:peptide/nickel transport system substrate-binding protein
MVKYFPSPLAPVVFGATDEFWRYDYDVNKAKQLLAEAGYPKGFELRLIYEKSDLFEAIALEVRDFWNKVVNVKLEMYEQSTFFDAMTKAKQQHVAAWGQARYAPYQFSQAYLTGIARNYSQYSNPATDEAITKATTSVAEQESMKYWREFQKIVTEDAVNYWVANGKSLCAIRNNVKGVVVMPTPGVYMLEKAYIQ